MLIDTHTHFYDEWLLPDAEAAIQRALDAGVGKMIQADIDSRERPAMWEIGRRHPGVLFQMLGVYPGSLTAENWQEELDQVHRLAASGRRDNLSEKGLAPMMGVSQGVDQFQGPGQGANQKAGLGPGPMTEVGQVPEQVLDQVQPLFGRGSILGAGPGPASVAQNSVDGTVGGPGPGSKIEPGPKNTETSSKNTLDQVHRLALSGGAVAIGEVGLDYHEGRQYEKQQKEALRIQLELAARLNLPVNIHLRDAWEDFLAILKDCRHLHLRGNLHCFSGSYEVYEAANRYGEWSVGIGGVVTFKNASLPKTLERIPMERILLETDAPYLAPVPHRGERNESAYLPLVAAKVAEVKGLSLEETERITTHNAETLFNI